MFKSLNTYKYEELRKLKRFFEECESESDRVMDIAGSFGVGHSVFFGNAIQHNSFEIPFAAMRLIYQANKERIDKELKYYEDRILDENSK